MELKKKIIAKKILFFLMMWTLLSDIIIIWTLLSDILLSDRISSGEKYKSLTGYAEEHKRAHM